MKIKLKPSIRIAADKNGQFTSFETWHRINGRWVDICQIFDGPHSGYYTNGKKEK
jgi:hypothetical protein